jgi:Rps23 Pro-64 3,4-dihydroxylase Tpa1-like proline 4-hydroxylase
MLHPSLSSRIPQLAQAFACREPFRHVVIDDFLAEDFLARVLVEFPAFEVGNARNESGELGHKSTVERIRELGPAYAELDDRIQSREFLDLISAITGIPDLLYDPHYFGGGTHENRPGQDLDAHVDFNRHPVNGWHRRLNLIVYLNPEWDDAWGGSLELHSDPRRADDRITRVTPLLNRAVIFETTEWSWHGFARIAPPAERQGLSRRSIALYFYSRERPEEELARPHSTIYVDRPLDRPLLAGHTLSADDAEQIRIALARRDQHVQRLYGDITRLTSERDAARENLDLILKSGAVGHLRRLARRLLRAVVRA